LNPGTHPTHPRRVRPIHLLVKRLRRDVNVRRGTTSVVPLMLRKNVGLSPCGPTPQIGFSAPTDYSQPPAHTKAPSPSLSASGRENPHKSTHISGYNHPSTRSYPSNFTQTPRHLSTPITVSLKPIQTQRDKIVKRVIMSSPGQRVKLLGVIGHRIELLPL